MCLQQINVIELNKFFILNISILSELKNFKHFFILLLMHMHGHWYGIRTERLYRSIAIEVRDRDGEFNVVSSHSIYRYRHIDLSLCSFLLLAIALPIQSFFCFASFLSVFPCVCVIFFAFWVHCVRFFCYFLFHFIGLIRLWTHISLSLSVYEKRYEKWLFHDPHHVFHIAISFVFGIHFSCWY